MLFLQTYYLYTTCNLKVNKFESSRLLYLFLHLPVCLQHIFIRLYLLILLDTVHEDRKPQLRSKVTFPDFSGKIYIFPKIGKMGLKLIKIKVFLELSENVGFTFHWM